MPSQIPQISHLPPLSAAGRRETRREYGPVTRLSSNRRIAAAIFLSVVSIGLNHGSLGRNGNGGVFKGGNGLLRRRYRQRNLLPAPGMALRCRKLTGMPVGGMSSCQMLRPTLLPAAAAFRRRYEWMMNVQKRHAGNSWERVMAHAS